jgi:pimeloyl-ACP methyl ester carboxylesterase
MSFSRSLLSVIWSLLGFLTLASVSFAQDNQIKLFTTRDGLAGDYVTAIAFARDGSVWIGTTEGVTHIEQNRWTSYTRAHGLGDSWITAIAIAPDERVWLGTQSGGVSVLDPKRKTLTTYNLDNSEIPSNFITQLVADSNNRVWIGTLNHGVAQYDVAAQTWTTTTEPFPETTPTPNNWRATSRGLVVTNPPAWLNPLKPYPTVLVHGWTVSGDDTLETSEFHFLKSYADRDGIPMYYAQGVSPKNTLYQNAEILRDEIARVKTETGADKVNLIGFSMGGMNTRAYLETSLYGNDVNRAIILGTPQAGVDIWKPILFQQILQKPDEPSTIELSPEYAQQIVNQTRAPNPNVPYDLLIGDARQQNGLDFLKDMPASDALISVNSSLALDGANLRKHINADLHDWGPEAVPLDLTSYLYPRETWERYLRNALRNNDNAPIGSEIQTSPLTPLPLGEGNSNLPSPVSGGVGEEVWVGNHTPVVTEKISAGEIVTRTVLIDENKSVRFIAYYPNGKLSVSLIAPDGKKFEPQDLPREQDGVLSLSTDIASFSGYVVKNAQSGEWQIILSRTDNGSKPIEVSTYAELDAPLQVQVYPNPTQRRVGEPKTILAFVNANAMPPQEQPRDVRIIARIAEPSVEGGNGYTFSEFELFDDGQHNDGMAQDGTYGNALVPSREGWHLAFVQVQGKYFVREQEVTFPIMASDAKLASQATVEMRGDEILIQANVETTRAGMYAVRAEIKRPHSDKIVARAFFPMKLDDGVQQISIPLDARQIPPGEYTVHLRLYNLAGVAFGLEPAALVATFTR